MPAIQPLVFRPTEKKTVARTIKVTMKNGNLSNILIVITIVWISCSHGLLTRNFGNGILHLMNATADVIVYDGSNQNNLNFLIVGNHPGYPLKRSLVKFEDIPSDCTNIKWAKMYLYFWYSHKASFRSDSDVPYIPRPLQVRQVKKSWLENQATRDNRLTGVRWKSEYLDITGPDAKKRPLDTVTIFTGRPGGYIEFDITKAARSWISGQKNNGLVISAENEDVFGREARFYSRERITDPPRMSVLCDE